MTRLALGQRYAALGLPTAAAVALARVPAIGPDAAAVLTARIEVALRFGDPGARELARQLVAAHPSARARLLLGRAQLAAGDLGAARLALVAALDARDATPVIQAGAHLALAHAAERGRDPAAAAHAATAWPPLCAALAAGDPGAQRLVPEAAALARAHGRADDARAAMQAARGAAPDAPWGTVEHALAGAVAVPRELAEAPADPAALDGAIQAHLDAGAIDEAVVLIARALRLDPERDVWWRDAAAALAASPAPGAVADLLAAAAPRLGLATAAGRLAAASADVARGEVLAGLATHGHRVKNVLGVLAARARSVRRSADGAMAERLVELERELGQLYDAWARYLRSMQLELPAVERIEVAGWLAEVVGAARLKLAADRAPTIALAVAEGGAELRGDRTLLAEAIGNLVDNAVEAGAAVVTVTAREVGGALVITVVDDGPGIAAAELRRVLAPGFTTKPTGSGLGLTVADRAVAAHQGRIEVQSEVGQGTTVTVTLPVDGVGVRWRRPR